MISIFFTGLGPGGLRKAVNFNLDLICVPGSSSGSGFCPIFRSNI